MTSDALIITVDDVHRPSQASAAIIASDTENMTSVVVWHLRLGQVDVSTNLPCTCGLDVFENTLRILLDAVITRNDCPNILLERQELVRAYNARHAKGSLPPA